MSKERSVEYYTSIFDLLGWVKRSDIEIVQISIVLIELCDVIGFVEKWNLYFVVNNYVLS